MTERQRHSYLIGIQRGVAAQEIKFLSAAQQFPAAKIPRNEAPAKNVKGSIPGPFGPHSFGLCVEDDLIKLV
jgi:hypothetical protein